MRFEAIKGMRDLLPPEIVAWNKVEQLARRHFEAHGFHEVRTPLVEPTGLFVRSIGATTAIVAKEMYTFKDKKNLSLTLRPEGTAPVVRACVESGMFVKDSIAKLYYFGPMYRYEQPQKGRQRQFFQIGAELLGAAEPLADAEILLILSGFFEKLGVKNLKLEVNSIGCFDCRPRYLETLRKFLGGRRAKLCRECKSREKKNPLRVLDCKKEQCQGILTDVPAIDDFWCEACARHYRTLLGLLVAARIAFQENRRIVRGLDYYQRTAFEVTCPDLGAQNAVAAGGRYDGLVKDLGGPEIPGVGFAIGMERLMLLKPETGDPGPEILVFFALLGEEAWRVALPIVEELREKGIPVECAYGGSLKSQMRRAHRLGAKKVVILGENEVKKGVGTVKEMATGSQSEVYLDRLTEALL